MADYKQMYLTLLRVHTEIIKALQEAHLEAEEIYISTSKAPVGGAELALIE